MGSRYHGATFYLVHTPLIAVALSYRQIERVPPVQGRFFSRRQQALGGVFFGWAYWYIMD